MFAFKTLAPLAAMLALAQAAEVMVTYYHEADCKGAGTTVTLNPDQCSTHGGNGLDAASIELIQVGGATGASKVQGYRDGSSCVGSTAFSFKPATQTRNQCINADGAAGSLEFEL